MGLVKRVSPGQKVFRPAAVENAMRAAAEEFLQTNNGAASDRGLQGRSTGIIRVKNTTGAALPRYAILGIDVPLVTPTDSVSKFKASISFKGVTPVVGTHEGIWVVLLQPLAIGGLGSALVAGVVQARISGATGDFAEIGAGGSTYLTPGDSGSARVLWDEDEGSTDERWAIVRIGDNVAAVGGLITTDGSTTVNPTTQLNIGTGIALTQPSPGVAQLDGVSGAASVSVDGVLGASYTAGVLNLAGHVVVPVTGYYLVVGNLSNIAQLTAPAGVYLGLFKMSGATPTTTLAITSAIKQPPIEAFCSVSYLGVLDASDDIGLIVNPSIVNATLVDANIAVYQLP